MEVSELSDVQYRVYVLSYITVGGRHCVLMWNLLHHDSAVIARRPLSPSLVRSGRWVGPGGEATPPPIE